MEKFQQELPYQYLAEVMERNDIALMNGNVRYFAGYAMKPDNFAGYVPKATHWRNSKRTDLPLGGSKWDIYEHTVTEFVLMVRTCTLPEILIGMDSGMLNHPRILF